MATEEQQTPAEFKKDIADLLTETGVAHHKAYEATNGADPDWAEWYATYSRDGISRILGTQVSNAYLTQLIHKAEDHRHADHGSVILPWQEYYADKLYSWMS